MRVCDSSRDLATSGALIGPWFGRWRGKARASLGWRRRRRGVIARGHSARAGDDATDAAMGKTAKRQNKRAAARAERESAALGARGASASAAAGRGATAMTGLEGAGVQKRPSGTSLGRVSRAVEAELTQEACVALDALLAEVERGERADAAPLALCSRVLGMCQKAGKAKPALRLLQRMELCGMPIGPVQLRQVFFACCARGMITDALALMSRRDRESNARMLGKDVLVRGCDLMPGGVDGEAGMALLEGTLRGIAGGGWEPIPANFGGVRVHEQPPWRPPPPRAEAAEEAGGGDPAHPGLFPLAPRGGDPAADAEALAPTLYPGGADGSQSFWFVCDDDGRRRPADREGLQLWAPSTPQTIPVAPAGLEPETERHDVPHVAGAFALSGLLTRRETAALRAAAHAVGWRRDAPDPDAPERGRLDYCEVVVWPETAARLWSRVRDHMPAGAAGINPRFRFFRYGPETVYRRHVDGSWPAGALTPEGEYVTDASDGKLRSKLTLLVYLSEGFEGGATTFYAAAPGHPGAVSARGVAPREGCALCFPHGDAEDSPVHEGSAVRPGAGGAKHKYIIRTDVLFDVSGETQTLLRSGAAEAER